MTMKQKLNHYILMGVLLPVILTSCLYEHPTMTDDGELGIDPTAVTVMANLTLSLPMPTQGAEEETAIYLPEETDGYRRRVIVEAYLNRQVVAREVSYLEITGRETELTIPVDLKLHARPYTLAAWVDYIESDTIADLYYDTQTGNNLMNIISTGYKGNSEWKDVFCGTADIDLTEYADEWNVSVPVDLTLTRPVARYALIADDVDEFLARISSGEVTGTQFTARLIYTAYVPTGYNVVDALPRQSLQYQEFEQTIRTSNLTAGQEFTVALDYVFSTEELQQVPARLEILNNNDEVIAATNLNLPFHAGLSNTLRWSFFTADPDGGVNFDPDFDGETDIDVPGIIVPNEEEEE